MPSLPFLSFRWASTPSARSSSRSSPFSSLFSTLGNNGWLAWMGELVPARVAAGPAACSAAAPRPAQPRRSRRSRSRARSTRGEPVTPLMVPRVIHRRALGPGRARRRAHSRGWPRSRRRCAISRCRCSTASTAESSSTARRGGGEAASVSAIYLLESLSGCVGIAGYGALVAAVFRVLSALRGRALDRTGALVLLRIASASPRRPPSGWARPPGTRGHSRRRPAFSSVGGTRRWPSVDAARAAPCSSPRRQRWGRLRRDRVHRGRGARGFDVGARGPPLRRRARGCWCGRWRCGGR